MADWQCDYCNGSGRGTDPHMTGDHLFNCSKCNGTGNKSGRRRIMTEQHETRDGKTWRASPAMLWICFETGEVVVTGDPRSVEPEGCPEDLGHNCDAAGCGQDHVLARGGIVGSQASVVLTWRPGGGEPCG